MKKGKIVELIPAVIYARYSSANQRDESIEGQIRECRAWADRNGFSILREYTDKALTGRTDRRPGFQKMIADSDKHQFQAVICWKTDRFARNRFDAAIYKNRLSKNGVRLFYAMEATLDGPEGIILESLMEGLSEYYSANLSENVKRGNYDSAIQYKTLGRKLLGYRTSAQGTYEIDPVEAPIVKDIFQMYDSGARMIDIIAYLNNAGFRTRFGGEYNKSSLRRILKNEKYIGIYEFGEVRAEDVIPPLVSKEQFERVQIRLKSAAHAPRTREDVRFLLTSKLFCGHCGEAMTGESATGEHGQIYYYYTCRKRRTHECKKSRVKKDDIEQFIIKRLFDMIFDDQFINDLADRVVQWQSEHSENDDRKVLEAQLAEVERQLRNITDAIALGGMAPMLIDKMNALQAQAEQLKESIALCLIEHPVLEKDQIIYLLEKLRSGDIESSEFQIRLIDTFLNSVYLYDDGRAIINLNYTKGTHTVTFEEIKNYTESSYNESLTQPISARTNFCIFVEGIYTTEARFRALQ